MKARFKDLLSAVHLIIENPLSIIIDIGTSREEREVYNDDYIVVFDITKQAEKSRDYAPSHPSDPDQRGHINFSVAIEVKLLTIEGDELDTSWKWVNYLNGLAEKHCEIN
jgi:hypothetical protein